MGLREWFKKGPESPVEAPTEIQAAVGVALKSTGQMGYVNGYVAGWTEAMIHSGKQQPWPHFAEVKAQAYATIPAYLRGPDA